MSELTTIPMFPLAILPLPGELVPLHIFEPRYKQLLQDAENSDITFGIFFNHTLNEEKIGSLMKLESVIKRYPGGESDIIVKCVDVFSMETLFRTFRSKMYPGGDVRFWRVDLNELAGGKLSELFQQYMSQRKITRHQGFFSLYDVANQLSLDISERYRFLLSDHSGRQRFLTQKIKFQQYILDREYQSRDSYHLN
ncbi:MAG: LON peptidase substrate-binding domain-containing protein [Flammeovirgaceae bacterium]|nr:MAG: LON peptidase substrate-binding domain-containing protein [Flammeovirgaceae bacterium]